MKFTVDLDNKTIFNYIPIKYSEPDQISLIKDRVLRGSLTQVTP